MKNLEFRGDGGLYKIDAKRSREAVSSLRAVKATSAPGYKPVVKSLSGPPDAARDLSDAAHELSDEAHEASGMSEEELNDRPGPKGEDAPKKLHEMAGRAHLEAAAAHEREAKDADVEVGRNLNTPLESFHEKQAEDHRKAAREHLAKAEEHAKQAGGEWDESKHPRDSSGKFA